MSLTESYSKWHVRIRSIRLIVANCHATVALSPFRKTVKKPVYVPDDDLRAFASDDDQDEDYKPDGAHDDDALSSGPDDDDDECFSDDSSSSNVKATPSKGRAASRSRTPAKKVRHRSQLQPETSVKCSG